MLTLYAKSEDETIPAHILRKIRRNGGRNRECIRE
jgi:hypothetical protein